MNRRGFIRGIIGLCAAPAIVRAGSLMPVKVIPELAVTSGNILLTPEMITRQVLKIYHQSLMEETYRFYEIATQLRIRLPNQYRVM